LISLQWYVLVLTSRLAVYTLLGKQDQIWAKIFCIPKNMQSRTLMAIVIIVWMNFILETEHISFSFPLVKISAVWSAANGYHENCWHSYSN